MLFFLGSIGMTERQARERYGDSNIKIYQSKFTPLYHALTARKQPTEMKLVCAGADEKVVGLHMMGRGCDEMLQVYFLEWQSCQFLYWSVIVSITVPEMISLLV